MTISSDTAGKALKLRDKDRRKEDHWGSLEKECRAERQDSHQLRYSNAVPLPAEDQGLDSIRVLWDSCVDFFELRRAVNRLTCTFSPQAVTDKRSEPLPQPVCKCSSLMPFLGDKNIADSFRVHVLEMGL